jgi:hypothetical protein
MFTNQAVYSPKAWALGIGDDKRWKEGEKKVIFKQLLTEEYLKYGAGVRTIGELAEKCTLELQNVEI